MPSDKPVKTFIIGGPSGRPILVPNSAVQRGYSLRKAYWKFPPPLPVTVASDGGCYKLTQLNGKTVYLFAPRSDEDDPPVDPHAAELRARLRRSVGLQRSWTGRL